MATKPTVIIIGAGIAGLTAGVHAQRSGFSSRIYELHSQPGGLMTAWKRKGFTIDGCIHWLVGTNPKSGMYQQWEEIGLIQDREIFNPEIFCRVELEDGRAVNFYTNIDRLEAHLLELAPEDQKAICEFCRGARIFSRFDVPRRTGSLTGMLRQKVRALPTLAAALPLIMRLGSISTRKYISRFQNPTLRRAMELVWMEEVSAVSLLMTFGWLHAGNAGYPIGGSLPMAYAVEKKYRDLGGEVRYNASVEKILTEPLPGGGEKAVGVRLAGGFEERADFVISAADGHATIFKMLEGRFVDGKIRELYESTPRFPGLLFIGLGVNNTFPELYGITGGIQLPAAKPFDVAGQRVERLRIVIHNYDPTHAAPGKSVITIMQPTPYAYWKELSGEPERYEAEKQRAALDFIENLDARFPGFARQVEMADIATPLTFERYTGNWEGCMEGWLPTPKAVMGKISKTLPGLSHFYMAGQWVQAGGGLPSGLSTGQEVVKRIVKEGIRGSLIR
jgi:phytoene dehydrogenase-like protein